MPVKQRSGARSEENRQPTAPGLEERAEAGESREQYLQPDESLRACVSEDESSGPRYPDKRRSRTNDAHRAGSRDLRADPAWPRRAIADHRETGPADAPAARRHGGSVGISDESGVARRVEELPRPVVVLR